MLKIIIFLMGFNYPFVLFSSVAMHGNFIASQLCPAYYSKNKKTNPGNVMTEIGKHYKIYEINRAHHPEWLRIKIVGSFPENLRWVKANCGIYTYWPGDACVLKAGFAEENILALTWLPAFCQTSGFNKGVQDCIQLTPNTYEASHLVLHGLWPNQSACGKEYNFCQVKKRTNYCSYPSLPLSQEVKEQLTILMPGYRNGSCFERYEWYKHGSCQTLSPDDYFAIALRLNQEVNATPLGQFLHEQTGQTVQRYELRKKIRQSFGEEAATKVRLICKKGLLVQVEFYLASKLSRKESLQFLMKTADYPQNYDACPNRIIISDFYNQSTYLQKERT